MMTKHYYFSKI